MISLMTHYYCDYIIRIWSTDDYIIEIEKNNDIIIEIE